jgi:hypothetical protein
LERLFFCHKLCLVIDGGDFLAKKYPFFVGLLGGLLDKVSSFRYPKLKPFSDQNCGAAFHWSISNGPGLTQAWLRLGPGWALLVRNFDVLVISLTSGPLKAEVALP